MNAAILYYDGFCEFEVVLAALQLQGHLTTIALEGRAYISEEQQKFIPDQTIDTVTIDEVDLLIIPGGNPEYLYSSDKLKTFMTKINKKNRYIAGICGGTFLMAHFGLLKNKKCTGDSEGLKTDKMYIDDFEESTIVDQDYVQDGNIITATGQAYVKFSIKLAQLMQLMDDDKERQETYEWFKYRGEQL